MPDLLEFIPDLPLDREDRQWTLADPFQPGWLCGVCFDRPQEALHEFMMLTYHSMTIGADALPVSLIECEPNPDAEDPDGEDSYRECARHEIRIHCVVDTEARPLEDQLYELSWWRFLFGPDEKPERWPVKVMVPKEVRSDLSDLLGDEPLRCVPGEIYDVEVTAHGTLCAVVGTKAGGSPERLGLKLSEYEVVLWGRRGGGDDV